MKGEQLYRLDCKEPWHTDPAYDVGGPAHYPECFVPVEIDKPEHQHQWLPWLTLPNGSSWTQCTGCGEQFQYDYP